MDRLGLETSPIANDLIELDLQGFLLIIIGLKRDRLFQCFSRARVLTTVLQFIGDRRQCAESRLDGRFLIVRKSAIECQEVPIRRKREAFWSRGKFGDGFIILQGVERSDAAGFAAFVLSGIKVETKVGQSLHGEPGLRQSRLLELLRDGPCCAEFGNAG